MGKEFKMLPSNHQYTIVSYSLTFLFVNGNLSNGFLRGIYISMDLEIQN